MLIKQTRIGGVNMEDLLKTTIPKDEQEEIKEFISIILLLPKEDRAVLLSNAYALKVRMAIAKESKEPAEVEG